MRPCANCRSHPCRYSAHAISALTLLATLAALVAFHFGLSPGYAPGELFAMGVLWAGLTVPFEFEYGFGHYVAGGLSALAYPQEVSDELVVAVRDPPVDANDRRFGLSVTGGRGACSPAERDADVSLGVGRLSRLAVGYRDASAMASTGRLDAPAGAVERLDAMFPERPV